MKKILSYIALIFLLILIIAAFLLYAGDTDRDEMIDKYSNAQSKFIDDGHGGQIHYRDEGNSAGPAILLIHGANSHLQTWESVVDNLKSKYRIISYDQPGHGLSGRAGNDDYSGDAMAAAGVKILDTLGVEKAVWVGNSMGGWVSWRAALKYPDYVSSLVLMNASGAQDGEKIEPYLGAKLMQTSIGQAILPYVAPRFIVKQSLQQSVSDPEVMHDALVTRYWELVRFPTNRQATIERSRADREPEKWDEIDSINAPTLILWGEEDRVIPVSHAKLFKNKIKNSEMIIYSNIGHLPMEENPDQVSKDIDRFISSQNIEKKE